MVDPTFRIIKTLFVLSFENGNNDLTGNPFVKYKMLLVKVRDFNLLIDNEPFLINL